MLSTVRVSEHRKEISHEYHFVSERSRIDTEDAQCAGERLYDYIEARLGTAPAELSWDEKLLRTWLPLDTWLREFPAYQLLDNTNWLAAHEHPRRILVMNATLPSAPGQHGRLCPIVTPEGPNFARIRSITLGATIRDRRLVVDTLHALTSYGFACARGSGASFSPFFPTGFTLPDPPDDRSEARWQEFGARVEEAIASRTDFDNPVCGPQLLSVKCGARGTVRNVALLAGASGVAVPGMHLVHGFCEGLSADELFAWAEHARESLGELLSVSAERETDILSTHTGGEGFGVLSRARRSAEPGIVFGHAAAIGEVDRLGDIESRLFVGLAP
ncbi:MAG: hypothetical protein GF331_07345 [Chitinivibrionales bacterium]|nr:hypothetical protein [Chitinivibrionales bacterium]